MNDNTYWNKIRNLGLVHREYVMFATEGASLLYTKNMNFTCLDANTLSKQEYVT